MLSIVALFIKGLCGIRKLKVAKKLFDEMVPQGILADAVAYNPLIHEY